ncbi:MAG: methyltransferase domain-containing protein [Phycisphaeraceae bacterium]|nr:methyltransferase domain-containing protein [Phycisphaeraceae bacterium]
MAGAEARMSSDWSMERLMQLATGYWGSAVLSAAVELGIFERLDESGDAHGLTVDALASAAQLDKRSLGMLLDALCGLGLVVRRGDRYGLEPSARSFLSRQGSHCLLDALRLNAGMYQQWGNLAEAVRSGKPVVDPRAHLGQDERRTAMFVRGMYSRALGMAPLVTPAIDLSGRSRLLDVGSGPGVFSQALAQRYESLQVTQFDLPGVLTVAEQLLQGKPGVGRITFHAGDYRRDALPRGFDAVLYCGALHQESDQTAAKLFARLREVIEPGGELFLVDMMLEESGTEPAFSTLFALNMMLVSPFSKVFRAVDAAALLDKCGFAQPRTTRLAGSPYWLIRAARA